MPVWRTDKKCTVDVVSGLLGRMGLADERIGVGEMG